ncbi:SDR family oxidoreductase [Nocardioides sp. QY071]|uniref:SDR family NAD(P)-dependent oxidoreductase n=1 Tax=Nocardioides sp. QY071 TaxID=3044187 RepID=UPI00249A4437|nr:SDR family oxidoreductase [Nocardioides sp. QY071]WGY00350.1 SDR family oxidoreductase [Nocardioides sp. QY071]
MRLHGQTIVVTGASSGLGLAMCRMFAAEGAHVYAVGRRTALLEELAAELGERCTPFTADVTSPEDLDALYRRVGEDERRLDVVVANAGGTTKAEIADLTPDYLAREWALNVNGTVFTVQKALPLLRDGGSVILLGSIAAEKGSAGVGAYAAAKAATRSFGRTWANELRSRRIRVNTISPGPILTDALDGPMRSHPEGASAAEVDQIARLRYDDLTARIPLGRVGDPDEVARLALFLASEESSFITGSNLFIDGGLAQV